VRGDAFALPFADHSFDFAYTLRFIRHFQVHDRRKVYAEIRRVLRPGGTFVLDAQNRAVSLPHRRRKGLDRYPIHDALYDRRELSEEIEEVGFRILKIEGILQHYGLQRRLNRLRRYGASSLARLAIETVEHFPGGNPSTWMILAEV
jgi:SAM-dependent methyltransferase